ncbi:F0F1 ATP synthase subunit B' [Roseomonas sp. CCTCC AB2023176]|uniref:F0F1 ATP synthase subunit B family protein n=1 Tax=Roseomonas sp. CCTCC AB2023176 TaxID=3342640 RepID=UPI0035E0BE47
MARRLLLAAALAVLAGTATAQVPQAVPQSGGHGAVVTSPSVTNGRATGTAAQGTVTPGGVSVPVASDSDRQRAAAQAPATGSHTATDAGGMPQLDFANPLTIAQVIWLFIIFGLLVYLASRYLLPPVAEVIENRRARIAGDLDVARDARAAAEAAEAAHRDATARARAEAQAAIADASKAAQAQAATQAEELNARLSARIAESEARIAASRDTAMRSLREASTDAGDAIVHRLAGFSDREAVAAAVGGELAARKLENAA